MRTSLFILLAISFYLLLNPPADAFWVWSAKTNKLVNPKKTVKDTPKLQFNYAMELFEKKDYKRAAEEFFLLTVYYQESYLAPEAQYYAGRSYEELGRYFPAYKAYQKTIDVYPYTKRTDELIERQFNLGNILFKKHTAKLMGKEIMTDLDRAVQIFQSVIDNVPYGEYAVRAQYMIGECYKKSEQYGEAAKAFQKLVDEYPQSEEVAQAKYEIAHCTYMASLKPDYDQELTDEAIEEFKRVAKEEEEMPYISREAVQAISMLENKKAEGLFKTAKFYQSQKHYKSAAIYYEEILAKYPGSQFSEMAHSNLSDISKFLKD
jgi:outer membrane assembly lipoprotein YfiO